MSYSKWRHTENCTVNILQPENAEDYEETVEDFDSTQANNGNARPTCKARKRSQGRTQATFTKDKKFKPTENVRSFPCQVAN